MKQVNNSFLPNSYNLLTLYIYTYYFFFSGFHLNNLNGPFVLPNHDDLGVSSERY